MRLASRFGRINQIRRDRPLTHAALLDHVTSGFASDKPDSRPDRYTSIATITIHERLPRDGFDPFVACSAKARDPTQR
ncbi:DUF945 domain-containing protein, partial [Klebsiella pneumoniae]|nr:DUF945 domain-containing protein [Klebsiella pneumoniae]